jgi:hypothetical protein
MEQVFDMSIFSPAGDSATISATTSSSRVALGNVNHTSILVANTSTTITAYVKLGDSTVTAAVATGIPILPARYLLLDRNPQAHTHLAGITASSTASVIATTGSSK